jgi:hypothetical protein
MKRHAIALGAAVLFGITCAWIVALRILPRPVEAHWVDGMYKRKELAAARIVGPKVVLIGGSGTHYSYLARVVASQSGLAVVNLGTHAGLGGEYILRRAMKSLNAGDTAVLMLEYQLLYPTPPSSLLSMFVMTSDQGYLLASPSRDIPQLLFGYSPVDILRQTSVAILPQPSPLNKPESVTSSGDESVNVPANKQPYMAATVHSLPAFWLGPPDPDAPPAYLVEFAEWAKQHHVRLLQAWPTTTFRPEYLTARYAPFFKQYAETFQHLGFRTVGGPDTYFPGSVSSRAKVVHPAGAVEFEVVW